MHDKQDERTSHEFEAQSLCVHMQSNRKSPVGCMQRKSLDAKQAKFRRSENRWNVHRCMDAKQAKTAGWMHGHDAWMKRESLDGCIDASENRWNVHS